MEDCPKTLALTMWQWWELLRGTTYCSGGGRPLETRLQPLDPGQFDPGGMAELRADLF